MNTEVSSILTQLGLSQYLGAFVDEGFDTWEALLDIQESDLLPDQNAPERPPTAYVRFSNKVREGLKDQNITFAEKAKLVGENWQTLAPGEKAEYESRAKAEKDQYRLQLEAYQKTDNHRQYSQYLSEFKQEAKRNGKLGRDYERQKLEPRPPGYGSSISSRVEARSGVGASVTSKEFDKCRVNQIPAISEPTLKRIHNHISSFQTHLANGRVKPGDDHSQLPPLTLEHRKERDNSPESALMLSVARASRIDKARLGGQAQTTSRATHQLRRHEVVPTLPDDLQGGLPTQQCANCRGPHAVDFSLCPARPKKINGVVRSLNRPEKDRVRRVGLRLFQQHTTKPASSPPREVSSSPKSQSATASDTTSTSCRSTPTSCDASTPEPAMQGVALRPSETPAASAAAPAAPNSQASPTPSIESASSVRHSTEASANPIKPSPAIPTTSTDSALSRASSAQSRRESSQPVRQSIETSEEPNEQQHRDKRPFRIFQANVGKNGPSHDCALALADAERYEVILLQEPWTQVRDSRCLTKTHPAYDTYSPVSTWEDIDTRPRVMTYIRRGARLLADQQRPALSRDILWLVVNGVTLVNVYREPNVDTALEVLFAWSMPSQCIIAGDFNARHHTWQVGPSRGHGGHIAEWAAENDLALLNPINTPTNAHGNSIDLAFSNIPLAEATVEDHLATSSDHFTLSISLPALKPATLPPGKILLASDEELKRFTELVVSGATIIPQAATTAADLDRLADAIIDLIQSAARAAGRRSQRRPRKAPWWNEECAASVAELRCVRRAFPLGFNRDVQLARRDVRRIVRRAKREFWRNLIDRVQSDKDVFKITRWLRRPGNCRRRHLRPLDAGRRHHTHPLLAQGAH
ncbi:transcriptional regulator family: HMG [Purpureocillium lilacinum]|uniref:Transcriptional regulator family: HMG n=1 Tax=Purpureocillium lilacinum TaxID=33203 RepID=A0ABR0BGT3_PURLI|nr:transcriptional regulator family: HMG [Purpureocillium lilacinum]